MNKFATSTTPWAHLLAASSLVLAAALAVAPNVARADGTPKVVKKVPPEFPGEATRKGITDGVLKAKLSIDGNGAVTEVAIVEATPPKAKIFSDAATAALNQWKFEATGKAQSFELKLVFSQE
ncbi:energy transducer TonB [Ideonella sp. DXS29W]|uniref:Energy transducer TonB n=1 Tax=Ideonella lacteola TaxID=2984193 RepID=A0ABU9BM35_9BURK